MCSKDSNSEHPIKVIEISPNDLERSQHLRITNITEILKQEFTLFCDIAVD